MPDSGDLSSNRFRHETKLPLQCEQYQELRPALIRLGLYPRRTHADRRVHPIYLDTPEFDDYQDSVSGMARRRKTRFRWYGEDSAHMALEVKRKKNKTSMKSLFQLGNREGIIPKYRHLLRSLDTQNPDQLPAVIASLYRPVLEVDYRRSYFELRPGIRMTIDQQIQYRRLSPTVSWQTKRSPVDYVVEFKYPVGRATEFRHLLRDLLFRVFRQSKYVVGMDTVTVG